MTAPRATPFDLTFGPALRKQLAAEQGHSEIAGKIPGLLLARINCETNERLTYGYYEPVKAGTEELFRLFTAEDIKFFIPQPQLRDLLAGMHLDLDENGRLEATPRIA